jgi:ABC-type branched-subunit amino acid transport system permease subunit
VAYAYARSKVTVDSFGILVALQFAAFAYVGGITVIPGALVTGLMAPEGVIPFVLHAELGLSQTWIVLVAGLALTVCMVLFPAGLGGSWRRVRQGTAPEALGQVELQRAA